MQTRADGTGGGARCVARHRRLDDDGARISFGAPFWFDLLNKMMVIRSTVKPHEKSPEEGSEDGGGGGRPPKLGAAPGSRRKPQGGGESANGNQSAGAGPDEHIEPSTWKDGSTEGVL